MTDSSVKAYSAFSCCSRTEIKIPAELRDDDLHVWLCCRDRFSDSDAFKRHVLAHYVGVAPLALNFELNAHGKPRLLNGPSKLDFNISHSGSWLACGVTAGIPVGVDIERCEPRRSALQIARRFFREDEIALLESLGAAQQTSRFFDYWTLKEAAVKARGAALAPGLACYGFELIFPSDALDQGARIIATTQQAADTAHYSLLELSATYRLAICWYSKQVRLPRLQLFELFDEHRVYPLSATVRASSSPVDLTESD